MQPWGFAWHSKQNQLRGQKEKFRSQAILEEKPSFASLPGSGNKTGQGRWHFSWPVVPTFHASHLLVSLLIYERFSRLEVGPNEVSKVWVMHAFHNCLLGTPPPPPILARYCLLLLVHSLIHDMFWAPSLCEKRNVLGTSEYPEWFERCFSFSRNQKSSKEDMSRKDFLILRVNEWNVLHIIYSWQV